VLRPLLVLASLAALAVPATAAARTWTVDDDLAQCPAAPFRTIQAAVDRASSGDLVRVCAGTYREQVVVSTPRLRLKSAPRLTATLAWPARRRFAGVTSSIVAVRADRVRVEGFVVDGDDAPCAVEPGGIGGLGGGVGVIAGSRVRVAFNRFSGFGYGGGCTDGAVVVSGTPSVDVDRNAFHDNGMAVAADGGDLLFQRNLVAGVHDPGYESPSPDAVDGLYLWTGHGIIRNNRFVNTNQSLNLDTSGDPSSGYLVRANRFERSRYAIVDQGVTPSHIVRNTIIDPFVGMELHNAGALVERNRIVRPVDSGIALFGVPSWVTPKPSVIRDNVVTGAVGLACFDDTTGPFTAGTSNRWARNVGWPSSPGVCRRG